MRHTPNLQSYADRAIITPQFPSHVGASRPASGAQDDEARAKNDDVSIGTSRLSQGATTEQLLQVQQIIRARGERYEHFESHLFADPAWDILLNLAQAEIEQRRTTISDLCYASHVPATTALRWINTMTIEGRLERRKDVLDRRRVYIELSPNSSLAMKAYLRSVRG